MQELSIADNHITSLPVEVSQLTSLTTLIAYGNQLTSVPVESLAALPNLHSLWLEGAMGGGKGKVE